MDEAKLENYLNEKESELTEKLTSLFEMPIHTDITSAEIQIFLDDECGDSASFWIYFDGRNKKVDKSDQSLFPGRSMEICDLNFTELETYEAFESQDKFDRLDWLANSLRYWFISCWKKSNGEKYSIPVEIAIHDGFGDGKVLKIS
jgi:hypothetical protein